MKIRITVRAGSKENEIIKSGEEYIVKTKEKAEKGRANKELIRILSDYFKKKVSITSGLKSRKKIVEIY